MRAVSRARRRHHPAARPQRRRPRRRVPVRPRRRRLRRPGRCGPDPGGRRGGRPPDDRPRRPDRVRLPAAAGVGPGPAGARLGAVPARRAGRSGGPRRRRREGGRRSLLGHVDRRCRRGAGADGPPRPDADQYTIEPVTPIDTYLDAVATVRDEVRAERLLKAVIAREIRVVAVATVRSSRRAAPAQGGVRVELPLRRRRVLRRVAPSCSSRSTGARCGRCRSLARRPEPVTRSATPRSAAALVESTKNQVEHRVVIDVVHDTLLPWCSYLDWEPEPSVLTVANVQHLATRIEGQLSSPAPPVTTPRAGALADAGARRPPREAAALALIADCRGGRARSLRRRVGWVDAAGNGTWAVAIRCAAVHRRRHRRPAPRRRRHRRRQRAARRAGRDPGQVPGDAGRPHPPVSRSGGAARPPRSQSPTSVTARRRRHRGSPRGRRRCRRDRVGHPGHVGTGRPEPA